MRAFNGSILIALLSLLIAGCGGNNQVITEVDSLPVDSPEVAAREWLEAVLDGDGETFIERTCSAEYATVQELGLLRQLTAWAGEEILGEGGSGSTSDTRFNVESVNGSDAVVTVSGEVISAVGASATAQSIAEVWRMRLEGDRWRWCGVVSSSQDIADNESMGANNKELQLVWTVQSGDIDMFVIASDGTIYGLITDDIIRHAVISSQGELAGISEVDTAGRIDSSILSGSSTNWIPQPDGALLIEGYGETAYLLPSGQMHFFPEPLRPDARVQGSVSGSGTPDAFRLYTIVEGSVDVNADSSGLLEYYELDRANGLVAGASIQLPNIGDYDFLDEMERQVYVLAYRLVDTGEIVVVDHAGTEVYRDVPDGARTDRFFDDHRITEWGDVWLKYTAVNEIGAEQGERVARIDYQGRVTYFEEWPWQQYRSIVYLPNRDEILGITRDGLSVLNRDLALVERFDIPAGSYPGSVLIGFDGSLYVFNERENTLTKFVR